MPPFSAKQYTEEGYTGPISLLSQEQAAIYRQAFFNAIGQDEKKPGPAKSSVSGFNLKHRWAHDIATHPILLNHIEEVLGPNLMCWAMYFWYKEPHNTKYIPWHQDAVYWPMQPRINMTAWVALSPTFKENGCLRIIPGSHKKWLDDHYQDLDSGAQFGRGLSADQVDESQAIDLEMNPGDVIFFSEATLHSSTTNISNTPRVACSIRYTTPEVVFDTEEVFKRFDHVRPILVRGEDTHHHNDAIAGKIPT
ncbi:MAG: phytanoyl-CoA dioxygenase family protein [Candidatus Latescibacterota bacterium]